MRKIYYLFVACIEWGPNKLVPAYCKQQPLGICLQEGWFEGEKRINNKLTAIIVSQEYKFQMMLDIFF